MRFDRDSSSDAMHESLLKPARMGTIGNVDYRLPTLHESVTKAKLQGHHNAGHDAKATSPIARVLFDKRKNKGVLQEWEAFERGKATKVAESLSNLRPPVSGPWECAPNQRPVAGLPKPPNGTPALGPKGAARMPPADLEEHLLLHLTPDILEDVAKWTNHYAAEQPVKLVGDTKVKNTCMPCDQGTPGQRHRCGDAAAAASWDAVTGWHVLLCVGFLLSASARRAKTPAALFVECDTLSDPLVKACVKREKFDLIMRFLSFADCADLETVSVENQPRPAKLAKIQPFLDLIRGRFEACWDMGEQMAHHDIAPHVC